jgi:hypothetical protein
VGLLDNPGGTGVLQINSGAPSRAAVDLGDDPFLQRFPSTIWSRGGSDIDLW